MAANGMMAVGACAVAWPLVDSFNPSKEVLALASVEVDISAIKPGEGMKVMWQGKPVFIQRRTQAQVEESRNVSLSDLRDPQKDQDRVLKGKDEWLVVVGVCTHLGCVPISGQGEYGGWFCPCHGSHYDASGRIRKGPAPQNLLVPKYEFISDTKIRIG